jgi:hypothetical protein
LYRFRRSPNHDGGGVHHGPEVLDKSPHELVELRGIDVHRLLLKSSGRAEAVQPL